MLRIYVTSKIVLSYIKHQTHLSNNVDEIQEFTKYESSNIVGMSVEMSSEVANDSCSTVFLSIFFV